MTSDAIALLAAEQTALIRLFSDYDRLVAADGNDDDRSSFARHICRQSTMYIGLREDLTRSAVRAAIGDEELLELASANREDAESLVEDVSSMSPDNPFYDAWVALLGCCLQHLIDLDRLTIFSEATSSGDVEASDIYPRWSASARSEGVERGSLDS
jgi:hypothetical protein